MLQSSTLVVLLGVWKLYVEAPSSLVLLLGARSFAFLVVGLWSSRWVLEVLGALVGCWKLCSFGLWSSHWVLEALGVFFGCWKPCYFGLWSFHWVQKTLGALIGCWKFCSCFVTVCSF